MKKSNLKSCSLSWVILPLIIIGLSVSIQGSSGEEIQPPKKADSSSTIVSETKCKHGVVVVTIYGDGTKIYTDHNCLKCYYEGKLEGKRNAAKANLATLRQDLNALGIPSSSVFTRENLNKATAKVEKANYLLAELDKTVIDSSNAGEIADLKRIGRLKINKWQAEVTRLTDELKKLQDQEQHREQLLAQIKQAEQQLADIEKQFNELEKK